VVGSDVLADAVAFFQAFAGMEGGFRDRARDVMGLLTSDRTRFVLVASPRHDTIGEAVWFARELTARHHAVNAAIVNRSQPRFGKVTAADARTGAAAATAAGNPELAALWTNLAELRDLADREDEVLAPLVEQIAGAPLVAVPLLGSDVHDLDGLAEIGRHLFDA
jgi:anion-transporting  ArsA/GET3 family ATPase